MFKDLAPGPWFKSVSDAEYHRRFAAEVLKQLDASEVWKGLYELTGGVEPVLLCWETLQKPGEWCHRQIVAAWIQKELGYEVTEIRA